MYPPMYPALSSHSNIRGTRLQRAPKRPVDSPHLEIAEGVEERSLPVITVVKPGKYPAHGLGLTLRPRREAPSSRSAPKKNDIRRPRPIAAKAFLIVHAIQKHSLYATCSDCRSKPSFAADAPLSLALSAYPFLLPDRDTHRSPGLFARRRGLWDSVGTSIVRHVATLLLQQSATSESVLSAAYKALNSALNCFELIARDSGHVLAGCFRLLLQRQ